MTSYSPPKVLISGAGLGGLFLAILLERAGIPYHVYERAATVKPLGAALGLNANILPAFDQLGFLEELAKIAFPLNTLDLCHETLEHIGSMDISGFKTQAGYDSYIFHRPDLYDVLLSKVPADKISFNKKVVSVEQDEDGVTIRTGDGTTFHGDILVGADGAYSAARQLIYKDMTEKNILPDSDADGPMVGHICMVGTTNPLDPEKFPVLKDNYCNFTTIIGHANAYTWMTATLPNNRMSYSVKLQLDERTANEARFRNAEWSPMSNEKMIQEIRDFPIKHFRSDGEGKDVQRTLGDLIDATDPACISKVFLEAKLYETWHHGRTVLIGDAVHKMQPSAGQGAVNTMEDAVILANCLYDLSDGKQPVTTKRITEAFQDYQEQRFCHAKYQVENSSRMSRIFSGQTWRERFFRSMLYKIPRWLVSRKYLRQAGYRPQVMFLPTVPNPPGLSIVPQKPSQRYLAEQEQSMAKPV